MHALLISSLTHVHFLSSLTCIIIIIAIQSRQHTGLTLRLIDKEKDILEKGIIITLTLLALAPDHI